MLSVRQGSLRREKGISLYPERRTRLCQCRGARVMGRKEPCEQTVCSGWSSTHFEHRLGGPEDLCQGVMPRGSCEAFGTLLVGMGVPVCWERWDGIILKDPAFPRQNLGFVFYKWAMYMSLRFKSNRFKGFPFFFFFPVNSIFSSYVFLFPDD